MSVKKQVIVSSILVVMAVLSVVVRKITKDPIFPQGEFIEQKMFIPAYIDRSSSFVRGHYETHVIYLGTKEQVKAWNEQSKKFPAPTVKKRYIYSRRDELGNFTPGHYEYYIVEDSG